MLLCHLSVSIVQCLSLYSPCIVTFFPLAVLININIINLSLFLLVPEDYDYNPHSGKRGDRTHHTELRHSSVEYIAPSEYMVS